MNEERGPLYLVTGMILGVILGLVYGWMISPVDFVDTPPAALRSDYKDAYRIIVASAYAASGDLERAKARLQLLGDDDPAAVLVLKAQQAISEDAPFEDAQNLAKLAAEIAPTAASETPSAEVVSTTTGTDIPTVTNTIMPVKETEAEKETPTSTLSPSLTPAPSKTPEPSQTPVATLSAPFVLMDQEKVCDPELGDPLIQVYVYDADEEEVPGIEIVVSWDNQEEHFFTGLKPDMGPGYADFLMTPDVVYSLQIAEGGQIIPNLEAPSCRTAGKDYLGSWVLRFKQP